jgi:predicted HicB family RNase H-like nuclease
LKAIDKANEQKVAAKLLQGGGKINTKDILHRAKELNREQRRSQVKKKLTRVEEKLQDLRQKADKEGLL